jgi:hypothetical protein
MRRISSFGIANHPLPVRMTLAGSPALRIVMSCPEDADAVAGTGYQ